MLDLYDKITAAAEGISARFDRTPAAAVILGTGLGDLATHIEAEAVIPYGDIPNFPRSTATSHKGQLVCGTLDGVPVVAMEGRMHAYEGYAMKDLTLPVRVFDRLGAKRLVVSNACGGLNPNYRAGDIMAIDDHINLMGDNPLIGVNDDRLGPRFPDMSAPYDLAMLDRVESMARASDIRLHRGVFVAVTGPNLETRAEYRFLRTIGADAVGMSTVPETIVAVHAGMRVSGFSVITDMCLPDRLSAVDVSEVIEVAGRAAPNLIELVRGVIREDATTRVA